MQRTIEKLCPIEDTRHEECKIQDGEWRMPEIYLVKLKIKSLNETSGDGKKRGGN